MHPSTRQHYVDAAQDARQVFGVFEVALRFVGVTAEVFLRRGFGERYLTAGLLLGACPLLLALASWIGGVSVGELPRTSPGTLLYLGSFIGFAVGRRAEVVRRCRAGQAWHSWCDGTPWRTWSRIGVSPDVARSVAEPLLVLAISLAALCAGDRAFAGCLMVVSAAMFLKEQRTRTRRREAWLDAQDHQIEDEELSSVSSGSAPLGTARGFVIPGLQRLPTSSRREIATRLRPVRDPVLPPPKTPALRAIPNPERASPAAASLPPSPGAPPVFLTVELVPLPPSHGARAAEERHEPVGHVRDQGDFDSGRSVRRGAAQEESLPEAVLGEESISEPAVSQQGSEASSPEQVVRAEPLPDSAVRDPSANQDAVRERSISGPGKRAYSNSAPAGDADEAAWVDAFATFRSRTRRAREAASELDASDLERN